MGGGTISCPAACITLCKSSSLAMPSHCTILDLIFIYLGERLPPNIFCNSFSLKQDEPTEDISHFVDSRLAYVRSSLQVVFSSARGRGREMYLYLYLSTLKCLNCLAELLLPPRSGRHNLVKVVDGRHKPHLRLSPRTTTSGLCPLPPAPELGIT